MPNPLTVLKESYILQSKIGLKKRLTLPSHDWYNCPIVIPYYGGKYELSKVLVPLIPPHKRYIEMFAGGLSMFFRKTKAKWNIVNDKDYSKPIYVRYSQS